MTLFIIILPLMAVTVLATTIREFPNLLIKVTPRTSTQVSQLQGVIMGRQQTGLLHGSNFSASFITPLSAGKSSFAIVPVRDFSRLEGILKDRHIPFRSINSTNIRNFSVDDSIHSISVFPNFRGSTHIIQSPRTTNRGMWGSWASCPSGSFASGMRLRTQRYNGMDDDTALNAIALQCSVNGSPLYTEIRSLEGAAGNWGESFFCEPDTVINGFQLRSENYQGGDDDTAGNNLRIFCSGSRESVIEGDGESWGTWTAPQFCLKDHAVCGFRTQVEPWQGGGDDTGLVNLDMGCCALRKVPEIRNHVRNVTQYNELEWSNNQKQAEQPVSSIEMAEFNLSRTQTEICDKERKKAEWVFGSAPEDNTLHGYRYFEFFNPQAISLSDLGDEALGFKAEDRMNGTMPPYFVEFVTFRLYTPENDMALDIFYKDNRELAINKTLKIIIHDFTENPSVEWIAYIQNRYNQFGANVVKVDWSYHGSRNYYSKAVPNTYKVGLLVYEFIAELDRLKIVSPHLIHIIGFGLGAQIAAVAGEALWANTGNLVSQITGLDPAGPGFESDVPLELRLDRTDAKCVVVMHTGMGSTNLTDQNNFGLGIDYSAGLVDIYVNNARRQPRCTSELREIDTCSHKRAVELYVASMYGTVNCAFKCWGLTGSNLDCEVMFEVLVYGYQSNCRNPGHYFVATD